MSFTKEDAAKWRFDMNVIHLNGGGVFSGWGHRCVDQPRLLVIDKYFKKDRSTKRSYLVDGKFPFDVLEDALAVLGSAPVLTAEQQALLDRMPEGWFVPEKRFTYHELSEMGLVEWGRDDQDRVTCRRRSN